MTSLELRAVVPGFVWISMIVTAKSLCVLVRLTLCVRLNMSGPNNGQVLSPKDNRLLAPKGSQARYTGERARRLTAPS